MSNDPKMFALDVLRREYKAFMEKVMQIPGIPMPKQQAAFRFEEGHMWMQQAIIHYVEPPKAPAPNENEGEAVADLPPSGEALQPHAEEVA